MPGKWESYRVFIAPVNWRFRSGDRFEFNANPTGERLVEPFEVARRRRSFRRARITGGGIASKSGTAQKRRLYTQAHVVVRRLLRRRLAAVDVDRRLESDAAVTIEFTGERNVGDSASGQFTQTLVGNRLRVNVSPDLSIASYVQYDTDSDSIGVNTRLRWTFTPAADLFVVYNHNVRSLLERWQLESNQLLIKLQYAWRM